MANFMPVMVFMEQRGRGWMIVRKEMRAFNRPEPELMQDERNEFVEVTVSPGPDRQRDADLVEMSSPVICDDFVNGAPTNRPDGSGAILFQLTRPRGGEGACRRRCAFTPRF